MTEIGFDKYTYEQPFEFYLEWLTEEQQETILKDWNKRYDYNFDDFQELSTKLMDTDKLEWVMQFSKLTELADDLFILDFGDGGGYNLAILYQLYGIKEVMEKQSH